MYALLINSVTVPGCSHLQAQIVSKSKYEDSISVNYALTNLAVFKQEGLEEKGNYEMTVVYWGNPSKPVSFTIY